MIRSFASRETKDLFEHRYIKKMPMEVQRSALRKLKMLDAAVNLTDLKIPPGNRLEKMKGSRQGQFSIRINDQWRICFRFANGEATLVEIVDYH